jgi:hypothetical protein
MDKKGAELSFNMIIIAVLGILVLVVVAAFFTTSFLGQKDKIDNIAGDQLSVAVDDCVSKCVLAQSKSTDVQKTYSDYCRSGWDLDVDGDGQKDRDIEGGVREYKCFDPAIGVSCAGVQEFCES